MGLSGARARTNGGVAAGRSVVTDGSRAVAAARPRWRCLKSAFCFDDLGTVLVDASSSRSVRHHWASVGCTARIDLLATDVAVGGGIHGSGTATGLSPAAARSVPAVVAVVPSIGASVAVVRIPAPGVVPAVASVPGVVPTESPVPGVVPAVTAVPRVVPAIAAVPGVVPS